MKTLFIALTILFSTSITAQNNKLKWGPEEKGERSYGAINAIGWNQGDFYTMQTRSNSMGQLKFYLEKIDQNLKLVYSKKLATKNYGWSYAKIIDNQLYLFQIKNKGLSMKEAVFYYNLYDLEGNFIKEVTLANIDGLTRWNQMNGYRMDSSPDGEKFGFTIISDNFKENYSRIVNGIIDVSDISKVAITSKTIAVSEDIKLSVLYNTTITNNGSMVITVGYKAEINDPYTYNFISLKKDGEYADQIPLKFKDGIYFDKLKILSNGEDKIIFSGFYLTQEKNRKSYKGFFLASLNLSNNKIESFSDFPYTEDFFKSLGYKVKKDGRVKFSGSYGLKIIPNEKSGGGFLIANHSYMEGRFEISAEAIIIPFDSNGKLDKNSVLAKKQSAGIGTLSTTGGSGYFAFCKNDKLYMLYNGSKKNINISDLDDLKIEKTPDSKNSATILATYEKGKGIKREILFSFKEKGGYLVPNKCFKDENKILLSIIDKKKVRYGIFEVN